MRTAAGWTWTARKSTENTRAAYPIHAIPNFVTSGVGSHPKNVIFLTADAFGVLPPIAKLTPDQALYYFLSGYTAKLAGTERGITEPSATFSTCFGAPFMVHYPPRTKYSSTAPATMLRSPAKRSTRSSSSESRASVRLHPARVRKRHQALEHEVQGACRPEVAPVHAAASAGRVSGRSP